MSTAWIHRLIIIVPEASAETGNGLWTTLFGEDADDQTFGVPLSADGMDAATHRGCNTAATEAMKARVDDFVAANDIPGLAYYRIEPDELILLEQVGGTAEIGQPFSWEEALADQGLQIVEVY